MVEESIDSQNETERSPKISCIVPVYNVEKYLRRCLDSICAQTFTDFECICVDDGSSDGSGRILDEYAEKDSRFVVIHKDNGGVSSARNAGLDIARGEWIAFVDSDDWVEKEWLEFLYLKCKENEADICWCDYIKEYPNTSQYIEQKTENNIESFVNDVLSDKIGSFLWNKIFRRKPIQDLIQHYGIAFEPKMDICEDLLFIVRLSEYIKKGFYLKKGLYHYFQRKDSYTNSVINTKRAEQIKLIGELIIDNEKKYLNSFLYRKMITKNWIMNAGTFFVQKKYSKLWPELIPVIKESNLPRIRKFFSEIAYTNYGRFFYTLYSISKIFLKKMRLKDYIDKEDIL